MVEIKFSIGALKCSGKAWLRLYFPDGAINISIRVVHLKKLINGIGGINKLKWFNLVSSNLIKYLKWISYDGVKFLFSLSVGCTKNGMEVQKPHMHSAAQKWRVSLLELLPFNLRQ